MKELGGQGWISQPNDRLSFCLRKIPVQRGGWAGGVWSLTHKVGRDDKGLAIRAVALGMGWDAESRDVTEVKFQRAFPNSQQIFFGIWVCQNPRKFSGIPEIIHYSVFSPTLYGFWKNNN